MCISTEVFIYIKKSLSLAREHTDTKKQGRYLTEVQLQILWMSFTIPYFFQHKNQIFSFIYTVNVFFIKSIHLLPFTC